MISSLCVHLFSYNNACRCEPAYMAICLYIHVHGFEAISAGFCGLGSCISIHTYLALSTSVM